MSRKKMIYGLLEVSALCMIVIVFYYYFALTPDAFLIASPHPFTIIAAMIGIRYGNYVGIMAPLFVVYSTAWFIKTSLVKFFPFLET